MASTTETSERGGRSDVSGGPSAGYSKQPTPLLGHALLAGTFFGGLGTAVLTARRAGVRLPERFAASDLALAAVATAKLARIVTRDRVTDFMRAPFTELEGSGGHGEVEEKPRGSGLRRSVGELVVCPYCISMWIAAGFSAGLITAPRATRSVAATLAVVEAADMVQMLHRAVIDRTSR
jgi:Protein of unknown function (DUF1360)